MTNQYDFQLTFLKLLLKRNAQSDSKLRITLLQNGQTVDTTSTFPENEDLKIKKHQKLVELHSAKTFHFCVNKDHASNGFAFKYEIKGTSEERVRTIPIDAEKMIQEYKKTKKVVFQQSYGGENAQISFKFYLTYKKSAGEQLSHQNEQGELNNKTKRSNSISRTKRPPSLNISKRTSPITVKIQEVNEPPPRQSFVMPQDSQLSNINFAANKLPYLTLNNGESRDQFLLEGIHKKISSLPLSEVQKEKELISTHQSFFKASQDHYISLKMRFVIGLLLIGIFFLLLDALSDRNIKRKSSKHPHSHSHNQGAHHSQGQQEKQHNVPIKKAKKIKAVPIQKVSSHQFSKPKK